MRSLGNHVVRWSVPSMEIPVVAVLDNGLHLAVYYGSGSYHILVFKPVVNYGVYRCAPRARIKWVKALSRDAVKAGLAEAVYPHVDIAGSCYRSIIKAVSIPTAISYNRIYDILEKFDDYTKNIVLERGSLHDLHPRHRRYPHTR